MLKVLSWALYDLANQFFVLNIVSLYFVRWLVINKGVPEVLYSISFGLSMFLVAVFAPFLGAISDIYNKHRVFLVYFTIISVIFTILLGFTNSVWVALTYFVIANFGCQEAVIFYNALMAGIATREEIGTVSGVGKMFGYSGAVIALFLMKHIIVERGYHMVFIVTGILFLVFALPCMIFVKEKREPSGVFETVSLKGILGNLKLLLIASRNNVPLMNFFKASFFGFGVINAVILFMSVYIGRVFGLKDVQIINFVLLSTIFAIVGSILSGVISDYLGHGFTLLCAFIIWVISLMCGALISNSSFYWVIGVLSGISLGSVWVTSRAFIISMVSKDNIAETFGLFNLIGYAAGIIGPLWWGVILFCLRPLGQLSYRISAFSLVVFLIIAGVFLRRILCVRKDEKLFM